MNTELNYKCVIIKDTQIIENYMISADDTGSIRRTIVKTKGRQKHMYEKYKSKKFTKFHYRELQLLLLEITSSGGN